MHNLTFQQAISNLEGFYEKSIPKGAKPQWAQKLKHCHDDDVLDASHEVTSYERALPTPAIFLKYVDRCRERRTARENRKDAEKAKKTMGTLESRMDKITRLKVNIPFFKAQGWTDELKQAEAQLAELEGRNVNILEPKAPDPKPEPQDPKMQKIASDVRDFISLLLGFAVENTPEVIEIQILFYKSMAKRYGPEWAKELETLYKLRDGVKKDNPKLTHSKEKIVEPCPPSVPNSQVSKPDSQPDLPPEPPPMDFEPPPEPEPSFEDFV